MHTPPPRRVAASYRDLDVWMAAMDLVVEVYAISARFPNDERFAIGCENSGGVNSAGSCKFGLVFS